MTLNDFIPFFNQYGYWLIFFAAFFESLIVASIFLPGSIIVLFGAYVVGQANGNIVAVFFLAWLGVIAGDIITYFLGQSPWEKLLPKKKFFQELKKKEETAHTYLHRFGFPLIVYAHLLGYFRSLICFAAGSAKMSFKKYFFSIIIASLLWSSAFVLTGYFFGITGHDIKDVNKKLQYFLISFTVLLIIFKIVESKLQGYMKNRLEKRNS
ncbi:MAG TPA: DedA family protein [Candidatus Saccharimonadales bacterium]|nr:DedA family protein [Candidatus Saccharimonadales bacterium]